MSLSKCYTSTPETTNTARLARLILGPCTDVLRDILKSEVLPKDLSKTVQIFTDNLKYGQRNPFNKTQSEIIFPKPTKQYSGDYSDLDISLLYLLLRNVSKITPHSKGWGEIPDPGDRSVAANIERIRVLRNQYYGHSADLSLSESEFRQEWRNIRYIVVELEQHLGTTTVYQDAVNMIKTCSMDPEQEKKYIDLLGDMRELHTTVDFLSNKMQIFQRELPPYDKRVAGKIETTKKMIEKHYDTVSPVFVRSCAFDRAKELMYNNGYVIIKGNPGTGKTTIAKMLMKQLMDEEGKLPLQLYKFTDIYENISLGHGIIALIDNAFGELSLSDNDVQEFTTTFEMIKILIKRDTENKSNSLILTLRNDVYQEFINQRKYEVFFQSSLIDICCGEYALKEQEMTLLLQKYNLLNDASNKDLIRNVSEIPLSIGFPQCCRLASTNPEIAYDIQNFILNPRMFLEAYFDDLLEKSPIKCAVLAFILFSGGKVDLKSVDSIYQDSELKHASLKFVGLQSSYINKLQKSMLCFEGFLTVRDAVENAYRFSHSSVQETLFKVIFNFDRKKMIQNCHYSLLNMLTTNKKPKNTQVVIEQSLFDDVSCRLSIVIESQSPEGYSSISFLELWNDSDFHEHILLTNKCIKKIETCRDINGDSMMVHFSRAGKKRWVESLLPYSTEREKYRSLNAACSKNKPDIVSLILSSGIHCDLTTSFYAVQSGNLELLLRVCDSVDLHQITLTLHPVWNFVRHSLLQEICFMQQTQFIEPILSKYPFLVHIKNDQGSNALQYVAHSGDEQAFNLLLKFGFDPYEKDQLNGRTVLTSACQNGRLGMVKYLIDDYPTLLRHQTDLHGRSILHWTAFGGKIDMFEYILNIFETKKILSITSGIKPNVFGKDKAGQSVLHCACENGQYHMCKYLLSRYPELLNLYDNIGTTVLHSAAVGGNATLFQFLLKKGLDINSKVEGGTSVLHYCSARGTEDLCHYIVNMYPDLVNSKNNEGISVLHSACCSGSVEIVSFLVKKGLNINALTNDGKSVIHFACLSGRFEVCEYLIENYPHLLVDNNGESILHKCCLLGKTEICKYLVKHHLDLLEIRDKRGWTVLHSACCGGSVEIVSFLIEKGMDIYTLSFDSKSILHVACICGKYEVCEYLIENYPTLQNARDNRNSSILHDATCGGNVEIIKFLLAKGMDIKSVTGNGQSILHVCIPSSHIEIIKYLIDHHSELLEMRDNNGWTVLHSACALGSVEIVSYLIDKGSDINVLTNVGDSILHSACYAGKYGICQFIVENHPNFLNERNNCNHSVLHYAACGGNVQILQLLIDKGVDTKSVNRYGETILHLCCRSAEKDMCEYIVKMFNDLLQKKSNSGFTALHSACRGGSVDIIFLLLNKGLDINALTNTGLNALHIACFYGKFDVCDYLVGNHPQLLDGRDESKYSVLHKAAEGGNIQIVKLLTKKGMDVKSVAENHITILHLCCGCNKLEMSKYLVNNYPELSQIRDDNGLTALHYACRGGSVEMVSYLIKKGFDFSELLKNGMTVIHVACHYGNLEVCEYLIENFPYLLHVKSNFPVLHSAAYGGNVQIVKQLIKKGLDIRSKSIYGETLLHKCCCSSKLEMCEYLVNHYSDLLTIIDNDGQTVLHSACEGGSVVIASFLIKKGVDINALTIAGESVLDIACLNWRYEMCEYLVDRFPQLLNVSNKFNLSVLHRAASEGNVELIKLFIEKGMSTKSVPINGKTILHYCCSLNKIEMCKFLVNHYSNLLKIRDRNGWTVLHSACHGGSVEIVSFLINKGLNVNALSKEGKNILHIACCSGKFEICQYLVENCPQLLDVRDKSSHTVLHDAAWGGNVQIVIMLIKKGLDIHSINRNGETILHQCCRSCKIELCRYLVKNYPVLIKVKTIDGFTVLHSACLGGSVKIVSFLIKAGFDTTALLNDGQSILHIACHNGKYEVCKYLVEHQPLLLGIRDKVKNSVLHKAALGGNVQILKILIDKGINIKSLDKNGETILHKCCQSGKREMCEYLVNNYSALLKIRANNGWTVLHSACCGGSVEIASILFKKGLDINALSNEHKSILHIACFYGSFTLCKYLLLNHPHLIDVKDGEGKSVMDIATVSGDIDMIQLLKNKVYNTESILYERNAE